jgi:hypothetical protein
MQQLRQHIAISLTLFMFLGLALPLRAEAGTPFIGKAKGQITGFLPGPGGVAITTFAEGHTTQLGRFSREENLLLDPNTGAFTGIIVFTAANGDKLFGTVTGNFISPTDAVGSYTFTGGTRRFKLASGGADFVVASSDGIHFNVTFRGLIE